MAEPSAKQETLSPTEEVERAIIDPPHPLAGAALAWLFPGAGHLYQKRYAKGMLFMLCLVPMFFYGMLLGGGKVAYASPQPLNAPRTFFLDRLHFICQAGIGAVALPALLERDQFLAGKPPRLGGWFYPPYPSSTDGRQQPFTSLDSRNNTVTHPDETAKWGYDLGFAFELGSIITAIAGLMNLLVIYDAYSGPMIITKPSKPDPKPTSA